MSSPRFKLFALGFPCMSSKTLAIVTAISFAFVVVLTTILNESASREMGKMFNKAVHPTSREIASSAPRLFKGVPIENLKIFVYPMPARFTTDILKEQEWCMKGPFATEWHFHQALLNDTVHRTDKPEEAHFFYVPVYSSCLIIKNFGKFPEYQQLVGAALTYVSGTFPYWNASHGSNHIWTFSHDFGACLGWTDQTTSVFYHEMRHSIFLTHNGDRRLGCYTPQKDIVVPSFYSDSGIMEVADNISSSGEARMTLQQRAEWGAALVAKKDIFGYFRGTLAWKHSHDLPKLGIRKGFDRQYSNGIRQKLARLLGRDSKFLIADGSDGNYLSEMHRSLFCLCPRGFAAWSRRLFDAIITNCIPVIIADDADQPFQQMLDYDAFSLRVAETELPQLKSILMNLSSARIYELLDNLQNVAHLFTYNQPMRHDDATYNVLVQLAAKASFK